MPVLCRSIRLVGGRLRGGLIDRTIYNSWTDTTYTINLDTLEVQMNILALKQFERFDVNQTVEDAVGVLDRLHEHKMEAVTFLREHNYGKSDKVKIHLEFYNPVTMRYGTKYKADSESTGHTVKHFFALGDDLYYVAGKMKARGFGVPHDFHYELKTIIIEQVVEDYSKEWANIAKSMRKHNINLNIAESIEAHLRGDAKHIEGMQIYWTKNMKPKRMSFKDVLDFFQTNMGMMKSVLATTDEEDYLDYRKNAKGWSGRGRDRSVWMKQNKRDYSFFSASEFAGCGNGDYYCMYSPTMAFFMESD